ncbi:DDE_3 domain-containing protein [Trichonephila clavipes]|nr:DDE_3 domain-containing protein [Trichonephila clavipes]
MARLGRIILGSRTDLHIQSVTMTDHTYRNAILEQHVHLFRGAMGAEFLFMDDNVRPRRANIVHECLQLEDITRMNWPAYSPEPVNSLPPVYRNFGGHCLMSSFYRSSGERPPINRSFANKIDLENIRSVIGDRGSLVVKETNSWPLCQEFVVQRARLPLNISRRKRPPVGVVQKLGEEDSRSGVVLVTYPCLKITRFVAISP